MRRTNIGLWVNFLLLGFCLVGSAGTARASETEPTIEISPAKIGISSFYHGEGITFSGVIPADCVPVLVVLGERKEHSLKRKGRVGPLWMNVGNVTVKDAPEMYYLLTSAENLDVLASTDILAEHGIGYDSLRQLVTIEQNDSDNNNIFQEFIKLKEKMGLYRVSVGAVELKRERENMMRFRATAPIPAQVPPGTYEVHVHCFAARQFISNSAGTFVVEKVGLTRWLSALAFTHAALYGILSILIAVAAGLLMGFLFGSKKKEPH